MGILHQLYFLASLIIIVLAAYLAVTTGPQLRPAQVAGRAEQTPTAEYRVILVGQPW